MHDPVVAVPGEASGALLVLDDALSFWGGVDPASGTIIDARHPQRGESVTGTVLVMPAGRGSSSSSSVLAELLRSGGGPAAIVMRRLDPIVATGAHVARELYGVVCPVIVTDQALPVAGTATIDGAGGISVS